MHEVRDLTRWNDHPNRTAPRQRHFYAVARPQLGPKQPACPTTPTYTSENPALAGPSGRVPLWDGLIRRLVSMDPTGTRERSCGVGAE